MTAWLTVTAVALSVAAILAARLGRVEAHMVEHFDRQVSHLERVTMSATQDAVDAVVAQLRHAREEIVAKIADVQAQVDDAGVADDVDLTALTAAAQALEDIVPDVPAEVPADAPPAEVVGDQVDA